MKHRNERIITFHNAGLGQEPWWRFERSTEHKKTGASDWKVKRNTDLDSVRESSQQTTERLSDSALKWAFKER